MEIKKPNKTLSVPFLPGEDLYYVATGSRTDSGPGLFEIKRQEHGIGAIQVDAAGQARIVDESSDTAELPGGQWHCLDERSALEWASENMPGAVRLDGNPVTAVYSGPDGVRKAISFGSTLSELEELVCSKPCTMQPDAYGIMAVYDANATRENAPYSTFINDASGRPAEVIYGPYLLIAVKMDDAGGFYHVTDAPGVLLDSLDRKPSGGTAHEYDPAGWTECRRATVSMLMDFLSRLPQDAVLHCCGTDTAYLHYCKETGALSVDCESLADLPEYEGREPALLKGPGA